MSENSSQQLLRDALSAHQRGELDRAETLYRALLAVATINVETNAEAAFLLGLLLRQRGRDADALDFARAALTQAPQESRYRDALVDVLFALAIARHQAGDLDAAMLYYRQVVEQQPAHPDALNNWGAILLDGGAVDAALMLFTRAVQAAPEFALAWNNQGNALRVRGDIDAAVAAYQRALDLQPDYADTWNHLGLCRQQQGDIDAALMNFDRALQLQPGHPPTANNRGNLLRGGLLRNPQQWPDALASYDLALATDPAYTQARYNRATLLERLGRGDEAVAELTRVVAEWPHAGEPLSVLLHWRRQRCEWEQLPPLIASARELLANPHATPLSPFAMITLPDSTRAEQRMVAERWSAQFPVAPRPVPKLRTDGRIRLGYMSADLHDHATAWLLARVIELHDRKKFCVIAYSYGPDDGGVMRTRLKNTFDEFHDVRALGDAAIAQRIAIDDIDVLIDLKGYTRDARAGILALAPAPLRINYLGYPATLGAHADYLVADPFLIPESHRADYSEAIAYLPRCYQPNDGARVRLPMPSRAAVGLPEHVLVLAAFHQTYKLNASLFAIWCELLDANDDAVLWLLDTTPAARTNLIAYANSRGIDSVRLIFAPKVAQAEHLARLGCADLLLDAFPVNGHTSVSDALWAGLPVLTCAGATFISRVAGSLLHTAGLDELVTIDLDAYRQQALVLATDRARLVDLRDRVSRAIADGYLFDSAQYTRDWETLLQALWQRHRQGLAPAVTGPL